MDVREIQRVLRARYGGAEACDLLVQFARIELQRPDALVWVQNGKFFEIYGHAARLIGRLLDLRVGEKPLMSGADRAPVQLAMTGVTIGGEREHLARLLRMGYRVAIGREVAGERDGTLKARQLETVITPGTIFDEDLLGDERQLLAAVALEPGLAGLALADVATGGLWCQEWRGADAHARLLDELARTQPAELLLSADLPRDLRAQLGDASGVTRLEGERALRHRALCEELGIINCYHVGRLSPLPGWWFDDEPCGEALRAQFVSGDLRPFGLADQRAARCAVGVLIRYLQWNRFPALGRLQSVRALGDSDQLQLDATSRRTLEILAGPDGSPHGSLLALLDQTRTPMGARLLRGWLTQGLRDAARLNARYDAVEACVRQPVAREEIRTALGRVRDLERVLNRLLVGPERAAPRDMARLRESLAAAGELAGPLARLGGLGLAALDTVADCAALLDRALAAAPRPGLAARPDEAGELLAAGWDGELDALLEQQRRLEGEVERLVLGLSLASGIRSLQHRRDSRTGQLLLTVAAADARRVPAGWGRVAKGKEQYSTDELRALSDELVALEEAREAVERGAWRRLWEQVAAQGARLGALAAALAQIDLLTTLAHVAVREGWRRPQIVDEPTLTIANGRHPVVCRSVEGYVPASVELDGATRLIALTGPNMSGKSTLMRMVALCVVLAQMGSFVPADAMHLSPCDRIFTRIGAADDIASGRSTFLVEMSEVATIVHQATPASLVVLDEVGRGTATYDGMALAGAILEQLHDQNGCRGLFATHYHQLVAGLDGLPGVARFQMGVRRDGERLVFLHSIEPGVAAGSFGLAVARMAGLPAAIVARAQERLDALEAAHSEERAEPGVGRGLRPDAPAAAGAAVDAPAHLARRVEAVGHGVHHVGGKGAEQNRRRIGGALAHQRQPGGADQEVLLVEVGPDAGAAGRARNEEADKRPLDQDEQGDREQHQVQRDEQVQQP